MANDTRKRRPRGETKGEDTDTIHGGFIQAARQGEQIRVRAEELSVASDPDGPPDRAKGRRTKLSTLGLNQTVIAEGDPAYKRCLYQANKFRKARMRELGQLHGHVSSGAGALLASASLALAASRFLYERYAKCPEEGGGESGTLTMASKLADSARQHELAAWELAAREGVIKRRVDMASSGTPWIEASSVGGRPKKTDKVRALLESCPTEPPVIDSWEEGDDGQVQSGPKGAGGGPAGGGEEDSSESLVG